MPARKVEDAIAPFKSQLGKVPDQKIAEEAKVSRSVVVNYRKKLGIPAYEGYKFGIRDKTEPVVSKPKAPKPARSKPAAAAEAPKAEPASRVFRGRKSKLDAYADMLGKVPDSEIARLASVTQENVRTYRMRRGIDSVKPVAGKVEEAPKPAKAEAKPVAAAPVAPAPAPAATPKGNSVFVVQLETSQGARTYAVVAADIGDAARAAMQGVSGRHGKASIKALQFVAELL